MQLEVGFLHSFIHFACTEPWQLRRAFLDSVTLRIPPSYQSCLTMETEATIKCWSIVTLSCAMQVLVNFIFLNCWHQDVVTLFAALKWRCSYSLKPPTTSCGSIMDELVDMRTPLQLQDYCFTGQSATNCTPKYTARASYIYKNKNAFREGYQEESSLLLFCISGSRLVIINHRFLSSRNHAFSLETQLRIILHWESGISTQLRSTCHSSSRCYCKGIPIILQVASWFGLII